MLLRFVRLFFLPLLSLLFWTGCARHVAFAPGKTPVRSAAISRDVETPGRFMFLGSGSGLATFTGMLVGGVGGGIAAANAMSGPARENARQGGVDIKEIVTEAFAAEASVGSPVKVVPAGQSSALFKLRVINHGFVLNHERMEPLMLLQARLEDELGRVVWRAQQQVMAPAQAVPTYDEQELLHSPSLLREGLAAAAQIASKGLIEDLRK
jgi:hypothetical protein